MFSFRQPIKFSISDCNHPYSFRIITGPSPMITVTFACPECQTNLKTSQRITAEQDIRCPRCGTVFPAPPETDLENANDLDEPASAKASPQSHRTKRVILLSALIVVLFTAGTAYLAWHTIENW